MKRRARLPVALALAVVAVIAGPPAAPQEQSVPATPGSPAALPPPLATGPAPDLDLVFTAEVAGYVEPCG
jgi:hypothetical protein